MRDTVALIIMGLGAMGAGLSMVLFQAFRGPGFLIATSILTVQSLLLDKAIKESG
jgi:hypothetical protein